MIDFFRFPAFVSCSSGVLSSPEEAQSVSSNICCFCFFFLLVFLCSWPLIGGHDLCHLFQQNTGIQYSALLFCCFGLLLRLIIKRHHSQVLYVITIIYMSVTCRAKQHGNIWLSVKLQPFVMDTWLRLLKKLIIFGWHDVCAANVVFLFFIHSVLVSSSP